MRYLLTIALAFLSLLIKTESSGQAVRTQKILGQGAYSRHAVDAFSGVHNQASLAGLSHFSAGVFIRQRFSMKELSVFHLALSAPLNSGTISLQGVVGGYSKLKRQEWHLAYARKLFSWIDVGGSLDYLRMEVPSVGTAGAVTFSLSALAHVFNSWHIGAQVFNPEQIHFRKLGNDEIPAVYQVGIGYQPSDILLLTTELQFVGKEKSVLFAFQYHIAKMLSLRAGVSTGVHPVFGGITLHLDSFEILLSAAYHQQLGWSPGAGIMYQNKGSYE